MNTSLKTILIAVDFSTGSRAALEQASRLAQVHGSKLHVLHVIDAHALAAMAERRGEAFESAAQSTTEGGRKALENWLAQSSVPSGHEITLVIGVPLHEILEHTKSLGADLLVAGIAGAGENSVGAGSVSSKLARKSAAHVLLVRADQSQPFQKIVACVDFSEHAQRVLALTRELALQDHASVDFLHVWADPGSMLPVMGPFGESGLSMTNATLAPRDELTTALQTHLHEFIHSSAEGLTHLEVLHEDRKTGRGIADHAREAGADLIIIGALGRTNLRYLLLGSTVERVLMQSACSMLVVKPAEV
ncbi:universal stress protein [Prosthecobacter sp.]|uniref:universal stress protein n=1 Tax=Prosthecobacter sp. TaxID=1965333 RepID=UPI002AB89CA9|nr:universal stress protein [Prosthecobacter sp.]MDZ4403585.1 universal stress protein [Prosthecobacter sp.]